MPDQLPELLSDVIDAATDDAIACNESPEYTLDMSLWHASSRWASDGESEEPYPDGKCHVCLGGAVLSRRLNLDRETTVWSPDAEVVGGEWNSVRILALNCICDGDVAAALAEMRQSTENLDLRFDRLDDMPDYRSEFPQFVEALKSIASELREAGL